MRVLAVDHDPDFIALYERAFSSEQGAEDDKPSVNPLSSLFDLTICEGSDNLLDMAQDALDAGTAYAVIFVEVQSASGDEGISIAEQLRKMDPLVNIVMVCVDPKIDLGVLAKRVLPPDKLLCVRKPLTEDEVLQFALAMGTKWNVEKQLQKILGYLQTRVEERTKELVDVNEQLETRVSQHELAEQALKESERFLENVFDAIQDGIAVLDNDLNIISTNRALERWYCDEMPLKGKKCYEVFHAPQTETGIPAVHQTIAEGPRMELVPTRSSDQRSMWHEIYIFPILDAEGSPAGMVEYVRDVTERVEAEDQIIHDAFHDKLTGLPNRSLLMDRLQRLFERAKRQEDFMFAVLMVDLDQFKVLNDSLGHSAGDQLLIETSARLQECLRTYDSVARLGGDEFAVLLESIKHVSDATRVAKRIQKSMELPFLLSDREVFSTASIGIALSAEVNELPEDFLRNADTAMFRAKSMGRDRYEIFDSDMHDIAMRRLELENDMRRAIEREEFRVYYQPIVRLDTGRISGFEALVRWAHPEKGLVSPIEFIPLAEETGMIVPIGRWVLHNACAQLQSWRKDLGVNSHPTVSVNLSGKQFSEPDLCDQVENILKETELDPECLRLEITESEVMGHAETAEQRLAELRQFDIQLYIDDFGTGYSSLSYLHRFPINALKIDRSFVNAMDLEAEGAGIVGTIVALANDLGLEIVVEGIETEEQLEKVRSLKCDYGQGYFFSKPVDYEAATELLKSNPQW